MTFNQFRSFNRVKYIIFIGVLCNVICSSANAQSQFEISQALNALYETEFTSTQKCLDSQAERIAICSESLRADGNAPFVLYREPGSPVAIVIHGLSDSPFFVSGIAAELHQQGYTVIAPLLPGHGRKVVDSDMQDDKLAQRWQQHVADTVEVALQYSDRVLLGGFSTGGALAVDYYLNNPEKVTGLVLFSGALALDGNVESLSKIWGIRHVAKLLDGEYQTDGPNPYKYPKVASFAGLELMGLIRSIRQRFEDGEVIKVPVFAAHSEVDQTTPIIGVQNLMNFVDADSTFYVIDEEHNVCHADLVVNRLLLTKMNFDKSRGNAGETCGIPQSNPQYFPMMRALRGFVSYSVNL